MYIPITAGDQKEAELSYLLDVVETDLPAVRYTTSGLSYMLMADAHSSSLQIGSAEHAS